MTLVHANEATASQRRVYFHLVDVVDGITPETGEAGGQPQISSDGGAWTNTGIGTLSAIGNGRFYADLTQAAVATAGTIIQTRYKSANTAECPGDSVQVVAFDPADTVRLGLTALPNAAAEASGGLYTRGTGAGQINQPSNGRIDASVGEYQPGLAPLQPTTPGNTLDVTAGGAAGIDWGNIENKTTTNNLTFTTMLSLTGSVGSVVGSVGSVTGNVGGSVGSVVAAVTVGTNNDKTGYSLSSAGVQAIWDAATSALTTAGSIGKRLVDVFAGMTSLPQWLGAMAGKQSANSTARTEMRATGAGSGTYDETADSLEAINDQGVEVDESAIASSVWSSSTRTLTGPARIVTQLQNGEWSIVKGDSRLNADGNAVSFTKSTGAPWPTDVSDGTWTVTLEIKPSDDLLADSSSAVGFDTTGTAVSATSVRFDITAADSDTLTAGLYDYAVTATKSGSKVTLESGVLTVAAEIDV